MSAQVTQTDVLRELVRYGRDAHDGMTIAVLCEHFDNTNSLMGRKLANLIYGKLVRSVSMGVYVATAKGVKLIDEGGEVKSGPKPGRVQQPRKTNADSLRARLWRAMLTMQRFTISDIVQRASNETDGDAATSARRFLSYLVRADYVVALPRRRKDGKRSSNGEKIFWLRESFGRLPPRARKKDGIAGMYDPNNDTWRPLKAAGAQVAA